MAKWVACLVVFLFGFVDVAMTLGIIGFDNGIRWVLHTPGAYLFHLVLLPLATCVLIGVLQTAPLRAVRDGRRLAGDLNVSPNRGAAIAWKSLLVILVATAVWQGWSVDTQNRMSSRLLRPTDVADDSKRDDIIAFERQLRGIDESNKRSTWSIKPDSKSAPEEKVKQYRARVTEQFTKGLDFWRDLGGPAVTGRINSTVAAALAALFLWALFLAIMAKREVVASQVNQNKAQESAVPEPVRQAFIGLLVVLALAALWVPLRAYSEYYLYFGDLNVNNHAMFTVVSCVLLCVAIGLFVLAMESVTWSIAASIGTVISTVVVVWVPSLLFARFVELPWQALMAIQLAFGCLATICVLSTIRMFN